MTSETPTLKDLGWSSHDLRQLSIEDLETLTPLRITEVHRNRATGLGPGGSTALLYPPEISASDVAVGDWVLTDPETGRIERLLDRRTEIARKAAGGDTRQLIAANVDTIFIVTSCNADFNVARLERYLALAFDADATAVIVLTKADQTETSEGYVAKARAISPRVADVIALDARNPDDLAPLRAWIGRGQTVAFLGSSGVGKSTLITSLTGARIATQSIREDDAKGRHTTTSRALRLMPGGGMVIDMPGIRELGLLDMAEGIHAVFDDIAELARSCRFRDCSHSSEPGCAVLAATASGTLERDRVERWRKLQIEDQRHSETVHERRERFRQFGRIVKQAKAIKGKKPWDH